MNILRLFTEKANHQALKPILCSNFISKPLQVSLSGSHTTPFLQFTDDDKLIVPNEMAKFILNQGDNKGRLTLEFSKNGFPSKLYAPVDQETTSDEMLWLEWESNHFAMAVEPLYSKGCVTLEAREAFRSLDHAIEKNKDKGICIISSEPLQISFLVDTVVFCGVFPALCEGGILPDEERETLPHLMEWFRVYQCLHEELLDTACEALSVQEPGDFLRAPRKYKISPKLEKTFFVTTPIYYVNAGPHIGHVYSTLIADVLGRYHIVKGENVFMTSGADEHGQKVAESAKQNNLTPYEFTTKMSGEFKECFERMGYNVNYFIRTTSEFHMKVVQSVWSKMEAKGDIYLGCYKGWYSVSDESFLTQQNIADGVDKDGKPCKISLESGHVVSWVEEENYMFRLSNFSDRLLEYYHSNPDCIVPEFRRREVIRLVEKGLMDLSVSRKFASVQGWAIPVPGNKEHCIYVWVDALFNYLSTACMDIQPDGSVAMLDESKLECWPPDIHVVGKDILKFHSIYWPAFLMSVGLPLPKRLVAHGWWTKDHKKISKSLGNVFDPVQKAEEFGCDALKYFLLRESNFSDDGDYSDKNMVARLNSELADTLGNLVMRCVAPKVNVKGVWPNPGPYNANDQELIQSIKDLSGTMDHFYCLPDIQKALIAVFDVLRQLNGYVTENTPWKLVKTDTDRLGTVLYVIMEGVRVCVTLLQPVLPTKSALILKMLGVPEEKWIGVENFVFGIMEPGTKIAPPDEGEVIFKKMTLPTETS
ncbi:unnamed protein product [Phytomonas sp. Hart1]|nr:unnamed protein product [Phytomonas sp. Hart1]|eukprot:CCW70293.1 unnamed protein product [Phytomonas sp. isolate Hart1]